MDFFSSPKRLVPGIRSRRIRTFHLSLIKVKVVSTGQAGRSAKDIAFFSETILKPSINKKGYLRVYLSVNSKKITKSIHRIVAETFIENPENKKTVISEPSSQTKPEAKLDQNNQENFLNCCKLFKLCTKQYLCG